MSVNYISKEELYNEFVKWIDKGRPDPMPDTIGRAIIQIVNGIASRPNFSSYSWLEEMKSDGIMDAVIASKKFDKNNELKNPFGFLSRAIWWSFLRRIEREKKETYKKHMALQNHAIACALEGDTHLSENLDMYGVNEDLIKKFGK